MRNIKIQLILLALMTSGFSAMYAPEFESTETGEKGGGPGEGEGDGAQKEPTEPIAEREGQDQNRETTNEPGDTAGGGDTEVFTPEELDSQQTALATLARQISTVVVSFPKIRFLSSNDLAQIRMSVTNNIRGVTQAVRSIQEELNRGDMSELGKKLKYLDLYISALESRRNDLVKLVNDTYKKTDEQSKAILKQVADIDNYIESAKKLQKQVIEYIKKFGDSGNHNLADNALTSLESLLGKKLTANDIENLGSTLKQLVDNASLDYLQSEKSRIEDILKQMQGIALPSGMKDLPPDVTLNMKLLDAGFQLNDANSIVSDSQDYLGSDFVNWIKNVFSSVWRRFIRKPTKETDDSYSTDARGIAEAMHKSSFIDKQALDGIVQKRTDDKRPYSTGEIGRIKVIIRRMAARRGVQDALIKVQKFLPESGQESILANNDLVYDYIFSDSIDRPGISGIVVDMLQADVNARKQTPLTQMFTSDSANRQPTQALSDLVEGMGEIPYPMDKQDEKKVPSGGEDATVKSLNAAVIFLKRIQFLQTLVVVDMDPYKELYSPKAIEDMKKSIRTLKFSSPIAAASMRSSLRAITKALYPKGFDGEKRKNV